MKKKERNYLLGNSPIKNEDEDLFNFKKYAIKIQKLIQLNSNNPEPITFGIYGKWGEGKTSLLNLIESKIDVWSKKGNQKGILKYHFNPWRYSSEDEMLFDFFDGLAKTLSLQTETNLQKVGKFLLRFSRYTKAVKLSASIGFSDINKIGGSFEASDIVKSLGEDIKGENITVESLTKSLNTLLDKADFKVVVFIDDVDRLDKEEVYTILKLIKLNANFNHFVYLITLDEKQVSKAIGKRYGKSKKDGKLFLDKIINIPIHIPRIEDNDLKYFFEIKLNEVKKNLTFKDTISKDKDFEDILSEYWTIDFESPREIVKILNSFFVDAFAIGEEVNLRDLFWVQVLKIKKSDCYNYIKNFYNKGVFERSEIIDFCDDLNSREKSNGKRVIIEKKFPKEIYIINLLFPLRDEIKIFDYPKETSKLRINYSQNFDYYFSFNSSRNITNSKIFDIRKSILAENISELRDILKDAFQVNNPKKELIRFENFVRGLKYEDNRLFFYGFLFENLKLIPNVEGESYNESYHHRIIGAIAVNLSGTYDGQSDSPIINLCKKLNANHLALFKRKIGDKLKNEIGKLIVDKAKLLVKECNPIYLKPKENNLVIHYWSEYEPKTLKEYINSTLINLDNLKLLIQNFTPFYNNEFYGALSSDDYKYIIKVIDVEFYLKKIKEFSPEIYNQTKYSESNLPDKYSKSTSEDSLKQFVFLHNYINNKNDLPF